MYFVLPLIPAGYVLQYFHTFIGRRITEYRFSCDVVERQPFGALLWPVIKLLMQISGGFGVFPSLNKIGVFRNLTSGGKTRPAMPANVSSSVTKSICTSFPCILHLGRQTGG